MPLIRGQPLWLVFAGAAAAGIRPAARRIGRSLRIALIFGRFGIAIWVPGTRKQKTGRPPASEFAVGRRWTHDERLPSGDPSERQRAMSLRLSKTVAPVRP